MKEHVLIKYSEIALKGKNKHVFEKALLSNIRQSAQRQNVSILDMKKEQSRVLATFDSNKEKIIQCLKCVLGIKNFTFMIEVPKSLDSILKKGEKILESFKEEGITKIAFKTKRSDKNFEINSIELNSKFGKIVSKLGIKVDYKNPQRTLYTEVTYRHVFMYSEIIEGYGGLPVRTSGRVLVLLSGGIDSPVASFLMMRRGLNCDFLHFHNYLSNDLAAKSKIKDIISVINNYEFNSTLYLIPYSLYEFETIGKIKNRYELVMFKHYIFKVAEKLAKEYEYDAIVSGDCLNQVASQTIENIKCTSLSIDIPVFRPLLTYEKEEIIKLAQKIGTYDLSIQKYKDCCSLVAKDPLTQTKIEKFKGVLEKSNLKELVERSLDKMKLFKM